MLALVEEVSSYHTIFVLLVQPSPEKKQHPDWLMAPNFSAHHTKPVLTQIQGQGFLTFASALTGICTNEWFPDRAERSKVQS